MTFRSPVAIALAYWIPALLVVWWISQDGPSIVHNDPAGVLPSGWQGFPVSKFYQPGYVPCSPQCGHGIAEYGPDLRLQAINVLIDLGIAVSVFALLLVIHRLKNRRHHTENNASHGLG